MNRRTSVPSPLLRQKRQAIRWAPAPRVGHHPGGLLEPAQNRHPPKSPQPSRGTWTRRAPLSHSYPLQLSTVTFVRASTRDFPPSSTLSPSTPRVWRTLASRRTGQGTQISRDLPEKKRVTGPFFCFFDLPGTRGIIYNNSTLFSSSTTSTSPPSQ